MWRYQIIPRWIRCRVYVSLETNKGHINKIQCQRPLNNRWALLYKVILFIEFVCSLTTPSSVPRDYSEKSITDFSLGYRLFGVHFRWYILVMGSLHSFRKLSRTSGSIVGGFFHALFSFLYFWLWHLTWEINPDLLGC